MTSILTGDIIDSRSLPAKTWLPLLKAALQRVGEKGSWEVFRGDSFQLEIKPQEALLSAIYIKAILKAINIDVRIAIGIGEKQFSAKKITESNGEAFIFSGEKLDELKKERINLAIQSKWNDLDYEMNIAIRLALIAMDNWSPIAADIVKLSIENPQISQIELAELTGKSQSSISEALKRAHYNEILGLDGLYRNKVNHLIGA
ncbi:MAG TPA: hypothetical protein VGB63_16770 [Pedobacter sp.]|jgi:hypothetical protein